VRSLDVKQHVLVWLALVALVALTAGSAYVPMGGWNTAVNFAIALVKAALVLWFFMRIGASERTIWIVAAAGVLWLAILVGLALADLAAGGV